MVLLLQVVQEVLVAANVDGQRFMEVQISIALKRAMRKETMIQIIFFASYPRYRLENKKS